MLGESQRNVTRLLRDTFPHSPRRDRTSIVLIDEVESFAVRRGLASFETNPVDVHRATDAVLAGLDHLAAALPGALVLTTTNFLTPSTRRSSRAPTWSWSLPCRTPRRGRGSSRRPSPTWPWRGRS